MAQTSPHPRQCGNPVEAHRLSVHLLMGPRLRVGFRRIGQSLDRSEISETFEASSIVVVDEAVEEGIAIGVRGEEAMGDATPGLLSEGFDDPPVEALDQTVGLWPIWFGQAMVGFVFGTDPVEGLPG